MILGLVSNIIKFVFITFKDNWFALNHWELAQVLSWSLSLGDSQAFPITLLVSAHGEFHIYPSKQAIFLGLGLEEGSIWLQGLTCPYVIKNSINGVLIDPYMLYTYNF